MKMKMKVLCMCSCLCLGGCEGDLNLKSNGWEIVGNGEEQRKTVSELVCTYVVSFDFFCCGDMHCCVASCNLFC